MLNIKYITLFSIAGIIIGYNFKGYDLIISLLLCIFCLFFVYYIFKERLYTFNKKKLYICYSIVLIAFMAHTMIKYADFDNKLANYTIENKNQFIGKIIGFEKETEYMNIYKYNIQYIDNEKVNSNIYLYVPVNSKYNINDILICTLKLELPFESKNEGCFNNKLYLFSKNIEGYGYLDEVKYVKSDSNNIFTYINNFKQKVISNILEKFDEDISGILISMLFSNKEYLLNEIKDVFSASNLSHILVVSGTHLSYITGFLMILLNKLSIKKKKIFLSVIIIFYVFLTNFSISILRSSFVYFISLIYMLCNRRKNNIDSLCIALLIFLIYNPIMLFNASIILSFLSVLAINLIYMKLNLKLQYNLNAKNNKKKYILIQLFSLTLSIYIVILPVISIYFNKIYITSIFSNIFAVPVAGYMIILLFIYMFIYRLPIISNILVSILLILSKVLIKIAQFFSFIPFSSILIYPFNLFELFVYYFVLFTIFINNRNYYYIKKRIKYILEKINKKVKICFLIFVILIIAILKHINSLTLKINFIDVGQGDCTLIRVNNMTILIDGGGSKSDFDVGEKVLMPYLLKKRIYKIDYIVITHFDIDHCGGLVYIINNFNVKNIVFAKDTVKSEEYYTFFNSINNRNINNIVVKQNDNISLGNNASLHVLSPINDNSNISNEENNLSIVCKLKYNDFSCLFTGDIDKEMEEKLVKIYGDYLKSDVIKIGHHGSKNSTTDVFLNKVDPKFSLIGVGKNNYGHPSNKVITNLNNKKVKIFRTDKNGEVIIKKYRNNNILIKSIIE